LCTKSPRKPRHPAVVVHLRRFLLLSAFAAVVALVTWCFHVCTSDHQYMDTPSDISNDNK